jgi:putative ABC transport system substrate-binding protein
LQYRVFNADTPLEIDAAFAKIGEERPDAVFVAFTPLFVVRRMQLVQLAAFHRIPAAYGGREFTEGGGLMSYGASLSEAYRQVGIYTGRILKGAKPADIPVVQSTKLELVVNHQTARMLGLTVPDKLIAAADEVIE